MNWHNGVEPKFKVGDVVYHKSDNQRGVIVDVHSLTYWLRNDRLLLFNFDETRDVNVERVDVFSGEYTVEFGPGIKYNCLETSLSDSVTIDMRTFGEAF